MEDLNLVVTESRLKEIPLETFYGIDNSPKAQLEYIAHFVADEDGKYLPKAQAIKLVMDGRTLADLEGIAEQLFSAMNEAAVPNGSGPT